jgi:hypothetical protein
MKQLQIAFVWAAVFILFLISQINVSACTCGGYPSVCDAYGSADAVFVGTVIKVEAVAALKTEKINGSAESIGGWKHLVKVEKTYKGNLPDEIFLAAEDNSCSGDFKVGSKLLLYAYFNKEIKMWEISACGRNSRFETANDDLLFLNGLPKTSNKTRISGDLARYEDTIESSFTRTQSFAGAKLKIASKIKTYEVTTDRNGIYEIYDLPSDVYTITPEIPKGLKIRFPIYYGFGGFLENILNETGSVTVDLKDNRCVGVDFLFNTDNKISGKVLDASGKPMKGVCLELIPVAEKVSPYFRVFDCTEEDGSYLLDDFPAGKYLILANEDGKISSSEPFPKLYYPNVFDREKAAIIAIGEGENLKNRDIKIPAQSETITVTGKLLYSDGKPVEGEFVQFEADRQQEGIEDKTNAKTDSQGRFSLKILKGLKGKIYGGMFTYAGEFENCTVLDNLIKEKKNELGYYTVATTPVELKAENNTGDMILTFPFPGCKKAKIE